MSELTAALMEQRDSLNAALAATHRTHMLLLATLAKIEARFEELESKPAGFDANVLTHHQLNVLGENMYERGSLKETISNAVEYHIENELDLSDKVNAALESYVDGLEIEVECSANLINRN
jgi:hypothetical protein